MGKMSRNKGNNFERDIAKELATWWYGEAGILRRVPMSGGWDAAQLGDVMIPPAYIRVVPDFPFYVECRNREGWDLSELFDDVVGQLKKWWVESSAKATRIGKIPLLIFSRAFQPIYVGFEDLPVWKPGKLQPPYIRSAFQVAFNDGTIRDITIIVMKMSNFFSCFEQEASNVRRDTESTLRNAISGTTGASIAAALPESGAAEGGATEDV